MKKTLLSLFLTLILAISIIPLGVAAITQGDIDVDMGDITKPADPYASKIIDFETPYTYENGTLVRMEQLTTGGVDNSGSLHVFKRTDGEGSVTFLNWTNVVRDKNDPIFVTTVEPNSKYFVTIDVMITENMDTETPLILYYDNYNHAQFSVDYSTVETGKWITYKGVFVTGADQTQIGTTFNAGNKHPEMYFDNFTITKQKKRYEGPQTDVLIDFENKDEYTIEQYDRTSIEETIGHTGETTNAWFSKGGTYEYATFINWNGLTSGTDDVFCIPVEPNSFYTVSMWLKVDKGSTSSYGTKNFDLFYHYEGYGTLKAISQFETIRINDVLGQGWIRYEKTFMTRADQTLIKITLNADKFHPDYWIDDITVKKQSTGYVTDTNLSYSENLYNLLGDGGYDFSGTVSEKTVFALSTQATKYTFGANLSGKGTVTLAFDEARTQLIKSIPVTVEDSRTGFEILADLSGKVYVILEPDAGEKITYKDMTLFNTLAFVIGTPMGYETNPADEMPNETQLVLVDQTASDYVHFGENSENSSAETDEDAGDLDSSEETDEEKDDGDSPETGDTFGYILAIIYTLVPVAVMTLATFIKKKRFN